MPKPKGTAPSFTRTSRRRALPGRIHFIGLCGRMVGGVAIAMKKLGVNVTGSDNVSFPPMPALIEAHGIPVLQGWSASRITRDVELVVAGTIVKQENPELKRALRLGIPVMHAAAFLQGFFARHAENLVISGTKGKTTTTAMTTWILRAVGQSPDYVIGAPVRGLEESIRLRRSSHMVLEGDEYPCSAEDPRPKFLRYHPIHVAITNVSLDHHEVYRDDAVYRENFVQLVKSIPQSGSLTLSADDAGALELMEHAACPVTQVGFSRRREVVHITRFRSSASGTTFRVAGVPFRLELSGRMNARNAGLAAVLARQAGVSLEESAEALRSFRGAVGRLELLLRVGRTLIYEDEAYHPLALRATLGALRSRYPRRRIVLLFEPRYTGGADGPWTQAIPESIAESTDVVITGPAIEMEAKERPFDTGKFCRLLRKQGVLATAIKKLDDMTKAAARVCQEGDIVLISFSLIRGELTRNVCATLQESWSGSEAAPT